MARKGAGPKPKAAKSRAKGKTNNPKFGKSPPAGQVGNPIGPFGSGMNVGGLTDRQVRTNQFAQGSMLHKQLLADKSTGIKTPGMKAAPSVNKKSQGKLAKPVSMTATPAGSKKTVISPSTAASVRNRVSR
jgi:hypothetical protein